MGLFSKKSANSDDQRVYAFTSLGMMARFMNEEQIETLMKSLPAVFAREIGTTPGNMVIVRARDWVPRGEDVAIAINYSDGSPVVPGAAEKLCERWVRDKGLIGHVVGDLELLGVIVPGGPPQWGIRSDFVGKDVEVTGATIFVTAMFAVPLSALRG